MRGAGRGTEFHERENIRGKIFAPWIEFEMGRIRRDETTTRANDVAASSASDRISKALALLGRVRGLFRGKPREFDTCAGERSGKWPRKKGNGSGEILPEEIVTGRARRDKGKKEARRG